jgi:hypothetical protein
MRFYSLKGMGVGFIIIIIIIFFFFLSVASNKLGGLVPAGKSGYF